MIINNNQYLARNLFKSFFANVHKYVQNRCKIGAKHEPVKFGKQEF